jgi:hypothetical protein
MVGDGVNQLFVYPARVRSSGEFTQAVIQVGEETGAGIVEIVLTERLLKT